ncbi:MAG: HD domain-containing protein [Pseudomonadota bacterium]
MAFLMEAERLRTVLRATRIGDGSRRENSAEHSWHLSLFALVLAEHAPDDIDLARVLKMLILHDIVEVDAGDQPLHGGGDKAAQDAAELAAADRLYGLLPEDQANELRAIWEEFEAAKTPEAQFAKALDRFQPPMLNLATDGGTWKDYGVTTMKPIEARVAPAVRQGAPGLWDYLLLRLRDYFAKSDR